MHPYMPVDLSRILLDVQVCRVYQESLNVIARSIHCCRLTSALNCAAAVCGVNFERLVR